LRLGAKLDRALDPDIAEVLVAPAEAPEIPSTSRRRH
jgi:hypothetical protein